MCVRIDGYLSATVDITGGVLQGSVLGLLLFLLYIDDMLSIPENSTCYRFADDTQNFCHQFTMLLLTFRTISVCFPSGVQTMISI